MAHSSFNRFGSHLRDLLISIFPLHFRSKSINYINISNRSELRLYEQVFVEEVFAVREISALINKDCPVIFDLGANCGFFSFYALDFFPKAKIHAFEPQRSLVSKFERTVNRNKLGKRIMVSQCAVGRITGEMEFFENRSPISASLIKEKVSSRSIRKKYKVRVTDLDAYAKQNSIPVVDILKIDVEGSELEVVQGGKEVLDKVKVVFVEVHPPFCTAQEIESSMKKHGLHRSIQFERDQSKDQDLVFTRQLP
jgi:FkbM family methyltransferase